MKVADLIVQNEEEHDQALHMVSAPVNMRLFNSNDGYKDLIMRTILHMMHGSKIEFEDYPKAQGISGANVGIPLNIVVVVTKKSYDVFLNPEIIRRSKEMVETTSNCGSLNLPKSIKTMRHRWVDVRYYDTEGKEYSERFEIGDDKLVASATLQHEIDHNLGILILDREVKDES